MHVAHPDGRTPGLAARGVSSDGFGAEGMDDALHGIQLQPRDRRTRAPPPISRSPRFSRHHYYSSLHMSRECSTTRTSTSNGWGFGSRGYGTTHHGLRSHEGTAPVEGSGSSNSMVPVVWGTPTPAAIMGGGCGGGGLDASPTRMAMLGSDGATRPPDPGHPAGPMG